MRQLARSIFGLFTAVFILIAPLVSLAATTVTDAYDQPTSLTISENSNHKFSITVASAVDEGDTLTLSFPTSFDTSIINEDDVDVADDGVDLTTAADCSGTTR